MDEHKEPKTAESVQDDIYISAAEWMEILSERPLDKVTARRFENWLRGDNRHQAVLERMVSSWQDPALTQAAEQAVEATPLKEKHRASSGNRRRAWWLGTTAAAASLLCAVVLFSGDGLLPDERPPALIVDTRPAQIRHLQLADGSHLEVNANSALSVEMDAHNRRVDLARGAAYFTVAPDKQRPFQVRIGDADVTAVGTEFNIDKSLSGTDVTVYEGAIEVRAVPGATPKLLRAGERVRIHEGRLSPVQEVDLRRLVDWRSGWIEIADESLPYLLEQLGRHSHQPIELVDVELAQLRVAGRFRLNDTRGTLALLSELYSLQVDERAGQILVKSAAR